MNIRKYQAPTMREALEQVKQELGEDALVLDTKKVRSRSFLGVGGREMVEVRVAAETPAAKTAPKKHDASGLTSLNLTDDAPATPAAPHPRMERLSAPAFAALAARAAAAAAEATAEKNPASQTGAEAPLSTFRGVELAETPPRVVHRPPAGKAALPVTTPPPASAAPEASSAAPRNPLSTELERLRAELREVKFSITSLASRHTSVEGAHSLAGADTIETDPGIYGPPFSEAYQELVLAGLPSELAHRAVGAASGGGPRDVSDPAEAARTGLRQALPSLIRFAADPLSVPAALVFVGPTGVGKTTTIAKLAARLALREKRRVELITLDTYRIAAVEQLKTYAEIIGTRCHVARSVVEVDALARRYAGEATVLIDTVGRSPHDLADQMELADYLRASEDLAKCLVLQATTHPTDALAAVRKFALYGTTHLVLTKLDETARPAATISVAAESGLPVTYLCHGQRVPEDIERATPEALASRAVRAAIHVG